MKTFYTINLNFLLLISLLSGNFKHDPVQLERIRQVMAGALEEGMKRRGIDQVRTSACQWVWLFCVGIPPHTVLNWFTITCILQKSPGIDDGDFNEKYEALRQERETRVNVS